MPGEAIIEVQAYTAAVVAPKPHEQVTAQSVKDMGQSLANRTKWIKAQLLQNFRLVDIFEVSNASIEDSPAFSKSFTGTSYTTTASDSELKINMPDTHNGDIVDISFTGAMSITDGQNGWIGMVGDLSTDGVPSGFLCSGCSVRLEAAMNGLRLPLSFRSVREITHTGNLRVYMRGRVESTSGSPTVKIHGPYVLQVMRYRAGII